LIRIGNEEYAKQNSSFGLTTMRNRHLKVNGATIHFEFRGKGGIKHAIDLQDPRLAKILRRCQELPGEELFQYVDERGEQHSIGSEHVNEYLHAITGADFTAKDFRTWAGTVLAAQELEASMEYASAAEAKRNVVYAIESVSRRLGNTRSICRKCYVHPSLIDAYLDGRMSRLLDFSSSLNGKRSLPRLHRQEMKVLDFLSALLKEESRAG
jgi:DNA topoisomerase-1